MTWTLVICIGVSWAGCEETRTSPGLSYDQCIAALEAEAAEIDLVTSAAFCRPEDANGQRPIGNGASEGQGAGAPGGGAD